MLMLNRELILCMDVGPKSDNNRFLYSIYEYLHASVIQQIVEKVSVLILKYEIYT